MYRIDEKDKVFVLKDVPQSAVGAPLPIILSNEEKLLLAYLLENTPENWNSSTIKIVDYETEDEKLAIVKFNKYASFIFGNPNDEAFSGHPLYERGLHPYAVFEIRNSSWLRNLEKMNSVHPYHNSENFQKYKHFIFAFHDSTFECVAENFDVLIHEGSLKSALTEMQKILFS